MTSRRQFSRLFFQQLLLTSVAAAYSLATRAYSNHSETIHKEPLFAGPLHRQIRRMTKELRIVPRRQRASGRNAATSQCTVPYIQQQYSATHLPNFQLVLPRGNAQCLDGSRPGYYFRQGFGTGANKWILYLEGGGWCHTFDSCKARLRTGLGSSNCLLGNVCAPSAACTDMNFAPSTPIGIMSQSAKDNPLFYNWNFAIIEYCDGGAHLGQNTFKLRKGNSALILNGRAGLLQVLKEMLVAKGLSHATSVLVAGLSAGGHSIAVQCDWIVNNLPRSATAKCLMDSGFFLDVPDATGFRYFRSIMQGVNWLHLAGRSADAACLQAVHGKDTWRCLFPEVALHFVQTPMFIANTMYDYVALCIAFQKANNCTIEKRSLVQQCLQDWDCSGGKLQRTPQQSSCKRADVASWCQYGQELRWQVYRVFSANAHKGFAFFLIDDWPWHGMLLDAPWNTRTARGMLLREAVEAWFLS